MSKEKEMLKAILANTNAIMEHLKINTTAEKRPDKIAQASKPSKAKAAAKKSK